MQFYRETLLCSYHYDPLDRLVTTTPLAQDNIQRYYLKDRLSTEVQGAVQRSIMQHDDQLLAQQKCQSDAAVTRLLVTDQQRSVLNVLGVTQLPLAYTPYGHRNPQNGLLSLLGFNGERPDPLTGCYLLGNGYRAFNPVLMRFNSPDSWSPFGKGGVNAYAYCVGDPVNLEDRTGHSPKVLLRLKDYFFGYNKYSRLTSQASSDSLNRTANTIYVFNAPEYSPTHINNFQQKIEALNKAKKTLISARDMDIDLKIQKSLISSIKNMQNHIVDPQRFVNKWVQKNSIIGKYAHYEPHSLLERANSKLNSKSWKLLSDLNNKTEQLQLTINGIRGQLHVLP